VLSLIQGFDSFQLGPSSAPEDIARAYQTQSLIWHPDKNPGDAMALATYKRLGRAYNMLMDPTSRAAHDASLRGGGPENGLDGQHSRPPVRQPLPEDLGLPPSSARPFAYVDKPPQPRTPAADAGMMRGDAIVRIGDASHLRDVQTQLQGNLHQPVPALVIELSGRFVKKWVIPRSWDPWAPASLLGCQMSDQCPIDLQTSHPAEVLERQRQRAAARMAAEEYHDDEASRLSSTPTPLPPAPCWARFTLALASLLGLTLGALIVAYPAFSYHIVDVWRLPALDCAAVLADLSGGGVTDVSFEEDDLLQLELAPLAREMAWPPAPPLSPLVSRASAELIRDGVRGILAASFVIVTISFVGLCLSCCPASHVRAVLTAIYLCCGLPSWVLLILVSVVAVAMRDQADVLVVHYWDCLKSRSADIDLGQSAPAQHEAYEHVETAAAFCISSAVALTLGMACACRVVGWHAVARHAIICISLGTGLLGAALLAVGLVLYLTADFAKDYFDYTLMGLGGLVFLVSLLGVLGSKRESPCLLRTYSGALLLVLAALVSGAATFLSVGSDVIGKWMAENWGQVLREHFLDITPSEFERVFEKHALVLITLLVLLVLVLAFDLLMVCVLQCSVSKYGRQYQAGIDAVSEREPLKRHTVGGVELDDVVLSRG